MLRLGVPGAGTRCVGLRLGAHGLAAVALLLAPSRQQDRHPAAQLRAFYQARVRQIRVQRQRALGGLLQRGLYLLSGQELLILLRLLLLLLPESGN